MKICTIAGRDEVIKAEESIKLACKQLDVDWIVCRGLYLFDNRNACIEMAGGEDVLFWDSDILATAEDVKKLIQRDKPIVSGAYIKRDSTDLYCARNSNWIESSTAGMVEVEIVGAGFLFIDGSVFESLKKPYFRHKFIDDTQTGEDEGFCMHARCNGYTVYLDCDCKVTHAL